MEKIENLLFKLESWQNTASKKGYNIYLSAKRESGEKVYIRAYLPKSGEQKFDEETRATALDGKLTIFIRRQRPDPKPRD